MKVKYQKKAFAKSVSEYFEINFKSTKLMPAVQSFQSKPHRVLNALLSVRNSIVKNFGFKTDKGDGPFAPFNLIDQTQNKLILDYDDQHFYFKGELFEDPQNKPGLLQCHCHVEFKTTVGKVYFYSISPFHKVIFKQLLKQLSKDSFKH